MRRTTNITTYILIFLLMSGFSACGDKGKSQQKPVAQKAETTAKAAPQGIIPEELKVEKEVYTYEPKDRRDPFLPLVMEVKEKPQRKKGATPIETFDVEEIKLIAIAWDNKQYYAMITLPDNKSYTIRKGMSLGIYGGRIEDITKDSVIIKEQVKDYKGQLTTKDTILKLRKEGEE